MLIIGVEGSRLTEEEKTWLRAPNVSGVILFTRNAGTREDVAALVQAIRDAGGDDMLVCVDQEGGRVQRLRDGFTRLPPLAALGAVYDRDPAEAVRLAEEHAWVMASELRATGIDFSFAPVLDLARGSAAIGNRAFHADPSVVAELGQAYVRGMHLAGMATVLKHFPGHGSVSVDTHLAAATDPRTRGELDANDIAPFLDAMQAHAEAVMVAHVTYPAVDDRPAGFSPRWIEGILRGELGFAGAVIGDDISMKAAELHGSVADRVNAHLDAGCDLVLACFPDVVPEAIAAVAGRRPSDAARIAALRAAIGASWDGLEDNPQRDRFVARVTSLESP